jgi:stearoyl-CoA desaturase (delta-9 desaturase)
MATAGPLPSDIQPVENETRDRIITGLVTLVPFVALGLAGWQVWGSALHWSDVFLFLGMYVLTGLGITIGFHRHLTHRSFKTYKWLHGLLAILGSAAIEGPVISWVADHRKHHAFADQEGDPHSPTSTTATAGAAPCAASSTPTWAGSSSIPSAAARNASRRT